MKPTFIPRKVSRSVAWRLAAGVLPSVLAVGLVAGLFYYGQPGRAAPHVMLIIGAALTLVSIAVAWINATYFAERLGRLARLTEPASGERGTTDEFDRIERAVDNLGSALTAAEAERARINDMAATRLGEQATMLAGVATDTIAQLDQVRLPLQILLESPFGELNENQEELLRDARAAADAIDVALRRLGQIADADRDALPVQRELVQINDVVRSVLPLARGAAERRGARTDANLEPGLPRVMADRTRLAEALALFVIDAAADATSDDPLSISTARRGPAVTIRLSPAKGEAPSSASALLAARLISAQGGDTTREDGALLIRVGSSEA